MAERHGDYNGAVEHGETAVAHGNRNESGGHFREASAEVKRYKIRRGLLLFVGNKLRWLVGNATFCRKQIN